MTARQTAPSLLLFLAAALCLPAADALAAPNDRVLFLLAEQFNHAEHFTPLLVLQAVGYKVDVAGPAKGRIAVSTRGPSERDARADLSLDEVDPANYVGLVLPGGFSPGNLEKLPKSIEICRKFVEDGKVVAAICHGPRLLVRAKAFDGKVMTCLAKMKDELCDAWVAGEYGRYVDRAVVVDGNLVTSAWTGALSAFCRATIRRLEASGGLAFPNRLCKAVVIGPGLGGHERWILTSIPGTLQVDVRCLGERDLAKFLGAAEYDPRLYDALMVMATGAYQNLKDMQDFRKLLLDFQKAGKTVLAQGKAAEMLKQLRVPDKQLEAFDGDVPAAARQLVRAARAAAAKRPAAAAPKPEHTAAVCVRKGFHDRMFAATLAFLAIRGEAVGIIGDSPGWVCGAEGSPVLVDATPAESTHLAAKSYLVSADAVTGLAGGAAPKELAGFAAAAAREPPQADAYTAAIALGPGFDGQVYAAMQAYLAVKGRSVLLVGQKPGKVRGVNGVTVQVRATYGDDVKLSADAIVVAPGRVWPVKGPARQAEQPKWIDRQDELDQKRLDWLIARHRGGATLMTFGLDSLYLGQRPDFKGKRFAAPSQTVWSFGKSGGGYAGERARLSDERLISAKEFDCIADAVKLLESPPAK